MSLLGKIALGSSIGLGLAGATTGAAANASIGRDPLEGVLIGGAVGASAVPIGMGAGAATLGVAGVAGSAFLEGGAAAVRGAPKAALGTAAFASRMVNGVGTTGRMATAVSPIRRHLNAIGGFGSKLVNWDLDSGGTFRGTKHQTLLGKATKTGGVKLTGLGQATLWGSAVGAGAAEAFREYNQSHMGQSDGMVTTATPRTPAYDLNAGASGDLVFALNKLRRG